MSRVPQGAAACHQNPGKRNICISYLLYGNAGKINWNIPLNYTALVMFEILLKIQENTQMTGIQNKEKYSYCLLEQSQWTIFLKTKQKKRIT